MSHCKLLSDTTYTLPIKINMPMLQALMARFAQVLQTIDLDIYGFLDR
jgi:hypothetical protein